MGFGVKGLWEWGMGNAECGMVLGRWNGVGAEGLTCAVGNEGYLIDAISR